MQDNLLVPRPVLVLHINLIHLLSYPEGNRGNNDIQIIF